MKKLVLWLGLGKKALESLTGLAVLAAIGYGVYAGVDSLGYISHSVETTISVPENWIVGEKKTCYSVPLDSATANRWKQQTGYVAAFIDCSSGSEHSMTVTLFGRLNQPEYKGISWRCKRTSEGFICYELGGD